MMSRVLVFCGIMRAKKNIEVQNPLPRLDLGGRCPENRSGMLSPKERYHNTITLSFLDLSGFPGRR